MPANPSLFPTTKNVSRMLCHYIQKRDNLKLNECPLQHQQVLLHSTRPELWPLQNTPSPHSFHIKQDICLGCFVLFTNYGYVQLTTQDFQPIALQLTLTYELETKSQDMFKVQSEGTLRVPFYFINIWSYVQLHWYSLRALWTLTVTSREPLTLWETTWSRSIL